MINDFAMKTPFADETLPHPYQISELHATRTMEATGYEAVEKFSRGQTRRRFGSPGRQFFRSAPVDTRMHPIRLTHAAASG
jgi:hypothetical protein